MILVLDNMDSFVYNLARYIELYGIDTVVLRSNQTSLEDIQHLSPQAIVISPGPCTPNEAGISIAAIEAFSSSLPILGICLGHQAIATAFGGKVVKAKQPTHGKSRIIEHDKSEIFTGIPSPTQVARYHSLVADINSLPKSLSITSTSIEGEIMSIKHNTLPTYGLQFHPESVLTELGYVMIKNFLISIGLECKSASKSTFI